MKKEEIKIQKEVLLFSLCPGGGLRALTWELTVFQHLLLSFVRALHEAFGASLVNIEALVYFLL